MLFEPTSASSDIPESAKDATLHSRGHQIRNLGVRLNSQVMGAHHVTLKAQVPIVNGNKTCLGECTEYLGNECSIRTAATIVI